MRDVTAHITFSQINCCNGLDNKNWSVWSIIHLVLVFIIYSGRAIILETFELKGYDALFYWKGVLLEQLEVCLDFYVTQNFMFSKLYYLVKYASCRFDRLEVYFHVQQPVKLAGWVTVKVNLYLDLEPVGLC